MPVPNYIGSRSSRILATEQFSNNKLITIPIPKDSCYMGLVVRIFGSVRATWASGTPLGRPEGPMDSLINRIDVTVNGADAIKSVRPAFLAFQQFLATGVENERFSSTGATALADLYPTTPGIFSFGTTTQTTTFRETVYLPFEHLFCEPGFGREMTWFNAKNYQSAELKINCATLANLLQEGNTAPVVFDNADIKIEVSTIENPDVPAGQAFHVWKQIQQPRGFKAAGRDQAIEIPKGNNIGAIMLYTLNGDTNTSPTNNLIETVAIRRNGMTAKQRSSFKSLQAFNRMESGVTAPTVAGANRLDGVCYLNMLNERKINSALPAAQMDGVNSLDLLVDTSSLATYTKDAVAHIMFDEIIFATEGK